MERARCGTAWGECKRKKPFSPRVIPTNRMQKMRTHQSGQKYKFPVMPSAGDKSDSEMATARRWSVLTGEDEQKWKEVMAPVESGQSRERSGDGAKDL